MTPEQQAALAALKGEPLTDLELATLTPHVQSRSDGPVAQMLSIGRTRLDPTAEYSSKGIAARYGTLNGLPGPLAAELCLQKIEGFAEAALASDNLMHQLLGAQIRRQMVHLSGSGMAVGDPALTEVLAAVVAAEGSLLTQEEADALQNVARVDDPISPATVSAALNALQGA
jgi:hypothetical protein